MLVAVLSSYGCTWENLIALEKIDLRLEQLLRYFGALQTSRVCYDSMICAEAWINCNRTCFILQFDPVTSQDSTSTTTCTTQSSSCLTSNTSSNKTETTVTTVTAVTVSPTVALTTSGGITSNVAVETDQSKAPNDSAETSRLHETNKERSESSTVAEQGRGKTSQTAARNNSSISDDTSKRDAGEDHVSAPAALEPPVSPTGSLHSESGASATGVREPW